MLNAQHCYMGALVPTEQPRTVRCPVIYDSPALERPLLFVFDLELQLGAPPDMPPDGAGNDLAAETGEQGQSS